MALTKRSTARPTSQNFAPEPSAPIKRRLQNAIMSTTGLCNCEQEIARLWSANLSRYTMRPST
jgi:hypothetical protein